MSKIAVPEDIAKLVRDRQAGQAPAVSGGRQAVLKKMPADAAQYAEIDRKGYAAHHFKSTGSASNHRAGSHKTRKSDHGKAELDRRLGRIECLAATHPEGGTRPAQFSDQILAACAVGTETCDNWTICVDVYAAASLISKLPARCSSR